MKSIKLPKPRVNLQTLLERHGHSIGVSLIKGCSVDMEGLKRKAVVVLALHAKKPTLDRILQVAGVNTDERQAIYIRSSASEESEESTGK
jgi:hypothetical protein